MYLSCRMHYHRMYVDNNAVRHNWHELLAEFQSDVAKDCRIDLHLEGDMSSFLSVRYLTNTETGEITADQEAYIDALLAKYNMTECNPNKVPLATSVSLDEIAAHLPCTLHPEIVSLHAQLIGQPYHHGDHHSDHCSAYESSCLLHDYCEFGSLRACKRSVAPSSRREIRQLI